MIEFISSWAEQIVIAVIVATIIEMILPKSKNRKYIQMVIGIYVLFNIISPIIDNRIDLSIQECNVENYTSLYQYEVDQTSMNEKIEKIYLEELENSIISKFEKYQFKVIKCEIDAELDTGKKNAGIHSIRVKIENQKDENELSALKTEIAEELEIEENIIKIKT